MGNNDDWTMHLIVVRWLADHGIPVGETVVDVGYPVGPHAIAASLTALGFTAPQALTAVMAAGPVLAARAALSVLDGVRRPVNWALAVVAGLSYLGAAYYAQASHKEVLAAVPILGFALTLPAVARAVANGGRAEAIRAALPPGAVDRRRHADPQRRGGAVADRDLRAVGGDRAPPPPARARRDDRAGPPRRADGGRRDRDDGDPAAARDPAPDPLPVEPLRQRARRRRRQPRRPSAALEGARRLAEPRLPLRHAPARADGAAVDRRRDPDRRRVRALDPARAELARRRDDHLVDAVGRPVAVPQPLQRRQGARDDGAADRPRAHHRRGPRLVAARAPPGAADGRARRHRRGDTRRRDLDLPRPARRHRRARRACRGAALDRGDGEDGADRVPRAERLRRLGPLRAAPVPADAALQGQRPADAPPEGLAPGHDAWTSTA